MRHGAKQYPFAGDSWDRRDPNGDRHTLSSDATHASIFSRLATMPGVASHASDQGIDMPVVKLPVVLTASQGSRTSQVGAGCRGS